MCALILRSHNLSDLISGQAFIFSGLAATLALSQLKLENDLDDQSTALPHTIFRQSLDQVETLVSQLVQDVPSDRTNLTVTIFCASSMLCWSAGFFAVSAKWALSQYALYGGGSMIEDSAGPQNKFHRFEKWPYDFLWKSTWVTLLIAVFLLICGIFCRGWYVSVVFPWRLTAFSLFDHPESLLGNDN